MAALWREVIAATLQLLILARQGTGMGADNLRAAGAPRRPVDRLQRSRGLNLCRLRCGLARAWRIDPRTSGRGLSGGCRSRAGPVDRPVAATRRHRVARRCLLTSVLR